MIPLLLIGGGGHCKACIDVIEQQRRFKIIGVVDLPPRLGDDVFGYEIIGTDDDLPRLMKETNQCFIALGQIGVGDKRASVFQKVKQSGGQLPVIVSPMAYVSASAALGEGTIVMHDAVINVGTAIGKNCIINTKALVEHDARIGNHSHIATGALINGDVTVGERSFIGSGAVVFQGCTVGNDAVIGGGQIVRRDVPDGHSPVTGIQP
jgi:sugar O-acyltransferase (sialic acid O-acetyltransferase NeuD family)